MLVVIFCLDVLWWTTLLRWRFLGLFYLQTWGWYSYKHHLVLLVDNNSITSVGLIIEKRTERIAWGHCMLLSKMRWKLMCWLMMLEMLMLKRGWRLILSSWTDWRRRHRNKGKLHKMCYGARLEQFVSLVISTRVLFNICIVINEIGPNLCPSVLHLAAVFCTIF